MGTACSLVSGTVSRRPSLGNVFSNWRESDLPLPDRFTALIRNNWKKLRTASHCCGNHGEPGC